MQQTKPRTALAVMTTVALLFMAEATLARDTNHYPRAKSMEDVRLVGIQSNLCQLGIREEVTEAGFLVTDNLQVPDAILEVKVTTNGSTRDHSMVEDVHYSAVLVGASDRVLVAKGGFEGARNLEEVCEDIGDEIADSMEDRKA